MGWAPGWYCKRLPHKALQRLMNHPGFRVGEPETAVPALVAAAAPRRAAPPPRLGSQAPGALGILDPRTRRGAP